MSPTSSVPSGSQRKPFDAQGFLIRRYPVILCGGVLLSLMLAPLLRLKMKPHYEASGSLLIDVSKEITLAGREREIVPSNIGDYVRTTVNRISSFDVLQEALNSVAPQNWPSMCSERATMAHNVVALFKAISVREEPRSFLITASMKAEKPDGLGTILNAVMQAFLKKLRTEQEMQSAHRLTYLKAERARVEERMIQQRNRLMEISDRVATKAVLHGNYTVHLSSLDQIQKLAWEAAADLAHREGALSQALSDQKAIGELSLKPYAEEKVSGNEGINRIEQWTYEQLQTLRSNIDGLTTQNRDRQYVEDRMTAMKSYLEAHKKRVHDTTNQFLVEKRAYDLQFDVIRAASAYESAKQSKEAIYQQLQEARWEASELGAAMFGASEIQYAMVHLRDRLASLNNRIDDCEMEAKSPIKISIERRASDPVHPARSAGSKAFIASVLVGFGLVGAVCLGFEMLDGRVRSVRHVDGALGGRSPEALICRAGQRDFGGWDGISSLWREDTDWARALKSLAIRLEGQRKSHGVRVVLVAGVSRESGATTLTANLAGALGESVRRVLFVEASLGRKNRRNGGNEMDKSLDRALEDVSAWIDSQAEGAGVCTVFASDDGRVTPAKMRELLAAAREVFDVILVNTAPVGEDDLAQFVALEVDAAVIVAREDRAQYTALLDALDRLRARPVPALTAVLNGFGQRDASRLGGAFRICLGLLRKKFGSPLFRVFGGISPT